MAGAAALAPPNAGFAMNRPAAVRRILLISLSNVGDAILTTPVLEALHRRWASAEITVLVGPRAVSLFERDPRVAQVMAYDKHLPWFRKLVLVQRLRQRRFDLVVDLRHSVLPLLIGARHRSPFLRTGFGVPHRRHVHLALLERMGIPTDGVAPKVFSGPEDEARAAEWLAGLPSDRPWIAVAPGARSHLKRWPVEGVAAVCDALAEEERAHVIFVGDQDDRAIAEQIARRMRQKPMDLTGRTTLRELAAIFQRMQLVLTNDSACLHLAVATRVPVVAVFGPTDPRKYGPTGPRDRVVRLDLVCAPCERALCPYGHECLQWLPARDVLLAVRRVLAP